MAVTYEPIANITVFPSTVSSITFSGIPTTYTDLKLVFKSTNTTSSGLNFRLNNDTSALYSQTGISGYAYSGGAPAMITTKYSGRSLIDFTNSAQVYASTTIPIFCTLDIINYSNTSTNKTTLATVSNFISNSDAESSSIVGLYRSTSAITSITIFPSSGNFNSNSTFALYGIKAA